MTFVRFTNEMSILIPVSTGGEAEAQRARNWLVLLFHRKVHQPRCKTNPVFLCPGPQLNPSGCYCLRKKSYVLLLSLVMQHLYLQIRFTLFSQHSLFSLISDVSSSVAQPDTFLHEEPCIFPSFSCPPLPSPSFSYVTNYSDSILIYKMYCQYHSGTLKTLPEQRCPFV